MRRIAGVLVFLLVLAGACAAYEPRTLDDIRNDPSQGDPIARFRNTSTFIRSATESIEKLTDIGKIFLPNKTTLSDWNIAEDAAFLSLNLSERNLGSSPTNPICATEYVNAVAAKLSTPIKRETQISILDCHEPNAYSMGMNRVGICRTFLLDMKTEDELAFVIGHELAHAALYHNDVLVTAEARLRLNGLMVKGGALALDVAAMVAVVVATAATVDQAATAVEQAVGIDEEDDAAGNLSLIGMAASAIAAGSASYAVISPVSLGVSRVLFGAVRMDVDRIKTRQEMDADRVSVELMKLAGYAPEAASVVLSQVWGGVNVNSLRAFQGPEKPRTASRPDLFSFAGVHPSTDERLAAMSGEMSVVSPVEIPSSLPGFCPAVELDRFRALITLVDRMSARSRAYLTNPAVSKDAYCADMESLAIDAASYAGDSKIAEGIMTASLTCELPEARRLVYAPYVAEGAGNTVYLFKLAAFQAWLGDSAGSYSVLKRLKSRTTDSVFLYRQMLPTFSDMGLRQLLRESFEDCQRHLRRVEAIKNSNICGTATNIGHSTQYGQGLAWSQAAILIHDSGLAPAALAPSRISHIASRYRENSLPQVVPSPDEAKYCPVEKADETGWIRLDAEENYGLVGWMSPKDDCLRSGPPVPLALLKASKTTKMESPIR